MFSTLDSFLQINGKTLSSTKLNGYVGSGSGFALAHGKSGTGYVIRRLYLNGLSAQFLMQHLTITNDFMGLVNSTRARLHAKSDVNEV